MRADFFQSVQADLDRVTEVIYHAIDTNNTVLYQAARYFMEASGKKFRPALVLLAGKSCDAKMSETVIRTAATLEFLHMASLVHDDIVDQADRRRGIETVNCHFSNKVAVLLGDYFYAKALQQAVLCGISVVEMMSDVIDCLVSGEWQQLRETDNLAVSEADYFKRIELKTARFISASCRLGALAVGASQEMQQALQDYGQNLGMAYQIRDDLLDIVGDEQKTGKTTYTDLSEGHITLPIIHALRESACREEFLAVLKDKDFGQPARQRLTLLLRDGGSIDYAAGAAARFAARAKECLLPLPEGAVSTALYSMADFACIRVH